MKTKVLIATYYWPPAGGPGVQRYLKFARYLPDFSIEPVILTVKNPTYPIQDPSIEKEVPEDLKIYKTKTIEPFGIYAGLSGMRVEAIKPTIELKGYNIRSKIGCWIRANIFIPDARAGWLFTARKKAWKLIESLDISTIITTGPPHSVHFIGKYVKEKNGVHWIADFRDPWSEVYYNQILPRAKFANKIDKYLEASVLEHADEVIAVTPSQATNLYQIKKRKYRVITNGFDYKDFEDIIRMPKGTPPYVIRHIGNIGEAAIPFSFLMAIKELSSKIQLKVEFIGDVHRKLPEIVDQLGLQSTVFFEEHQPHQIAIEKMCNADILLLSIPDVENNRHHIPGKLFEYLNSGSPILVLGPADGDAAKILTDENAGVTCEFNDIDTIKITLTDIIRWKSSNDSAFNIKNHPYSRGILTGELSRLIHS